MSGIRIAVIQIPPVIRIYYVAFTSHSAESIAVLDLQKIIFDLKASGIGVLVTDHNVRETLSVTDRAYIINDGKIFRAGTPEQLGNYPEVKKVYLGESFTLV